MSKFPRLEQLRAERERAENELLSPYKRELDQATSLISYLRPKADKVDLAESLIGSAISQYISEEIGRKLSAAIFEKVKPADLPAYRDKSVRRVSAKFDRGLVDRVAFVEVNIPPLAIRQFVSEDALER